MNSDWFIWGLLLFLVFLISLCFIIYSARMVDWISKPALTFLKQFGDIPNPEGQREIGIWWVRIFGIFGCGASIFMLVSAIIANR